MAARPDLRGRILGAQTRLIKPGKVVYVPKGESYGCKVVEGPHQAVVVWTPAMVY